MLRSHRRPVRLLRLPEETHELTRSGTPFRRVENLQIVVDWFRHFLVAQARPPSGPPGPRRPVASGSGRFCATLDTATNGHDHGGAMIDEVFGRDAELAVVEAFLDRPVKGLRALVLEGRAGIGKSTIWLAGVAAARDRSLRVLTSRPAETERTLAHVVLGDLFAHTDPDVLAAIPTPRRRAFESALLLGDTPQDDVDPRALGVAIVTLLPLLMEGAPLVLAIDDDQWIDPSSAEALGFALRRSADQPVFLLLARRVDSSPATGLEEAIDATRVERLRVGPLSVGAIQALIRHRLEIAVPRPTLVQIHEVSGGNAFYSLELARARSANPARDSAVPFVVPAKLERLVGARVDALDDRTRAALLLVAAHGRMPVELIRALDVPAGVFDQALTANLIDVADGVVRFTHPLLASGIYHAATSDERRAAHCRLAAVLDDPVRRGRHLALSADAPDDELATALESAVSVARERGMAIASAELAEHALRLTPSDAHDDRHRRSLATARAHMQAGEGSRARSIVDDLLLRERAGPRRAEALILASELANPRLELELLEEALIHSASVPRLQAEIHALLAHAGSLTKGRNWAEPHAQASLRLAERLDDDGLRVFALSALAGNAFARGDPHALELASRAYSLAKRLDELRPAKEAAGAMGWGLEGLGSAELARPWLEREITEWRDRDEQFRSHLLSMLALVEVWAGRWDIASKYAEESREIGRQYEEDWPQAYTSPALIAMYRGDLALAREHSRHALSLLRGQVLPNHTATLAICDLWSGEAAAALADFIGAEAAADFRGWDEPNDRWWRDEYADALLQLGRLDEAAQLVADWEAAAVQLGRVRVLAQALRCRGQIAAARGDLPTSLDLLARAVDRFEAANYPFGRARAFLALGVARLRARQKRTAREALEAALAGFEVLGAVSWAATARAELARIGGRERIEGLSPSELRVAELVAHGRTNREIASALFLGERTVAGHLTRIYAKLEVRSRTELARKLLSRGPLSSSSAGKVETS